MGAIIFILNALALALIALLLSACSPKLAPPPLTTSFGGWDPPETEFRNQHKHWAYCLDVYDGDTATFWIENGFNNFQLWKTRFLDIDAPEVRGKEKEIGRITQKWLAGEILGKYVLVEAPNGKLDKYGRLLVRVYAADDLMFNRSYNQQMVDLGLAEDYTFKASDLMPVYQTQPVKN